MHVLLLETIALIGATVHTMEPGTEPGGVAAPAPATVLIEDGLIVAVGPDVEIPEDAERIELTGLHLVPGLTDGFATFDPDHDALWLSAGVTRVRDGGSPVGEMVPERAPGMRDRHPGPDLLIGSPIFVSSTSGRGDGFVLGPAEQAAEQVAELLELMGNAGATFDYFQHDGSLDEDQLRVVCQAGLAEGVESWGPATRGLTLEQARAAGQRGLIGLESLLPQGARFETLTEAEVEQLDAAVSDLAAGGWWVSPMLMGTARILRGAADEAPAALDALGPMYQVAWRADLEAFRMIAAGESAAVVEASVAAQRALTRKLHQAGVQLVPGSGAPSGGIAPGGGLVDELEEWVAAGIPAPEVLALATRGSADAMGGPVPSGRVAPGHRADLLALSSDPRRSIGALRSPEVMVLRGRVREGFELEESLALLVEAEAAARAERSRPVLLAPPPMPEGQVLASGMLVVEAYGERTAVERYEVTELPGDRTAYGARVWIPPTPTVPARELVMVQVIHEGLVEFFDLTLDQLDEAGKPQLMEGHNAFVARGRVVPGTRKLAIERGRFGEVIDRKRGEEPIAAVDGSMALMALIAGQHFPEGPSFVVSFEGLPMEPMVDRLQLTVEPTLHRMDLVSQRSQRTFGLGAGGDILFAARASATGRIDGRPVAAEAVEAVARMPIDESRAYTGDPATWASDALGSRGPGEDGK